MRRVNGELLWLGALADASPSLLLAAGIEAVIELTASDLPLSLPREVLHCRFPLNDGGDNPAWLLRLAIDTAAALLRSKVPLFVGCSAGLSRSVAISAVALARYRGLSLDETLRQVVSGGPADVSPVLWKQLQSALAG